MTRRRIPSRQSHNAALAVVLALITFSAALLLSTSPGLAKMSHEYERPDGTLPWVEPPVGGDDDEPTATRSRGKLFDLAFSDCGDATGGEMPSDPDGSWFGAVRRTAERVWAAVRVRFVLMR
jgi:hypothetical protein